MLRLIIQIARSKDERKEASCSFKEMCSWVTEAHPCSREGRGGVMEAARPLALKGGYDKDPSQSIGGWRVSNGDTHTDLGRGGGGLQGLLILICLICTLQPCQHGVHIN